MCGNPRRWWLEPTIQERVADSATTDEWSEE
jgi:hypothetical protein